MKVVESRETSGPDCQSGDNVRPRRRHDHDSPRGAGGGRGVKSGAKIFDADGWVSKVRFVESRFERDQK